MPKSGSSSVVRLEYEWPDLKCTTSLIGGRGGGGGGGGSNLLFFLTLVGTHLLHTISYN